MSDQQTTEKKKYPRTVAPLWKTKKEGGYWMSSIVINQEMLDTFKFIIEQGVGGSLSVRPFSFGKNATSPHAYLEYVEPADVAAFRKRLAEMKAQAPVSTDSDI